VSISTRRKNIMKNTCEYFNEKKRHFDEKKITAFCNNKGIGNREKGIGGKKNPCPPFPYSLSPIP